MFNSLMFNSRVLIRLARRIIAWELFHRATGERSNDKNIFSVIEIQSLSSFLSLSLSIAKTRTNGVCLCAFAARDERFFPQDFSIINYFS